MPGESAGFIRRTTEAALSGLPDKSGDCGCIAMTERDRGHELGDWTELRSDVKERRSDPANVVHLGGMNDSDKLIAHHNGVQIRRRERRRKLVERLVRNAA